MLDAGQKLYLERHIEFTYSLKLRDRYMLTAYQSFRDSHEHQPSIPDIDIAIPIKPTWAERIRGMRYGWHRRRLKNELVPSRETSRHITNFLRNTDFLVASVGFVRYMCDEVLSYNPETHSRDTEKLAYDILAMIAIQTIKQRPECIEIIADKLGAVILESGDGTKYGKFLNIMGQHKTAMKTRTTRTHLAWAAGSLAVGGALGVLGAQAYLEVKTEPTPADLTPMPDHPNIALKPKNQTYGPG